MIPALETTEVEAKEKSLIPREPEDSVDNIIEIRNLRRSFGRGGNPVHALHGVNLNVRRGQIHGVLGASGSGKTTLLQCVARLQRPDEGSIVIEGQDWATLGGAQLRRERHKLGVVFQHLYLLSSQTVAANVAMPLHIAGASSVQAQQRVSELLDWLGIQDKAQQYPAMLSGGQRQRVAIARALATSPHLLLADEPTSALDTETKFSVLQVFSRISQELGITVLMITHDLEAAKYACDTISVLDSGLIVETATPHDLLTAPTSEAARRLVRFFRQNDSWQAQEAER